MSILHKSFIDKLLSIDCIDTQLDFLFDTIGYHLMIKEYEIIDEYILEFNNRCESFNLYVGFLTITASEITFLEECRLKNLEKLQMRAITVGQKIMSFKDSISTMHGLLSDKVIKIKTRKEKLKQINGRI